MILIHKVTRKFSQFNRSSRTRKGNPCNKAIWSSCRKTNCSPPTKFGLMNHLGTDWGVAQQTTIKSFSFRGVYHFGDNCLRLFMGVLTSQIAFLLYLHSSFFHPLPPPPLVSSAIQYTCLPARMSSTLLWFYELCVGAPRALHLKHQHTCLSQAHLRTWA